MNGELYEYEFGPYRLKMQPQNQRLPARLFRGDEEIELKSSLICRLLVYLVEHRYTSVLNGDVIKYLWQGKSLQDEKRSLTGIVEGLRELLGDNDRPHRFIERGDGEIQFIYQPVLVHHGDPMSQPPDQTAVLAPPGNVGNSTVGTPEFQIEASPVVFPGTPNISVAMLPSVSPLLIGREEELHKLDEAWISPKIRLVSIVAFGGTGKTALSINWWHRSGAPGAQRVLGWSFYSQGAAEDRQASADLFLDHALRHWFKVSDPPKDSWARGELLADLIRRERTLVILDGLEPIQFGPGPQYGRFKDRGMVALLKELAAQSPGLCVCTSRECLADLSDYDSAGVLEIDLDNLSPENGAKYLASLGVRGEDEDLRSASQEFGNHALALTLLGSLLKRYGGDARKRDTIPSIFEAKQGAHARRVLRAYENLFKDRPELDVLRILGLFDRPADPAALGLLRKQSFDAWAMALENLAEARLVQYQDPNGSVDCHPLVREHFSEEFREFSPDTFREFHSRLYAHYAKVAPHRPDTLETMTPLFNAVYHGCQADRHEEACETVYKDRILRGDEFFQTQKLGAFGSDLSLLSNFFERPWTTPSQNLKPANRIWVTAITSFVLRVVGRLSEALDPMQVAAADLESRGDWDNACQTYDNLSELQLNLGNITQAIDAARRSIELADRSGETFSRMARRARLGAALHQAGRTEEAGSFFKEAEDIEREKYPNAPFLTSLPGFQYCDLLLDQGMRDEVLKRAKQAKRFSTRLLGIGLDNLSLARASEPGSAESSAALDQAVGGLRQAGYLDYLLPCLLARAEHWRITGDFSKAQHDLDEVRILAIRFGMKLIQADYHLKQARVLLDQENQPEAVFHYKSAMELIQETGYHRRDQELLRVGARVGLCPTWLARFENTFNLPPSGSSYFSAAWRENTKELDP